MGISVGELLSQEFFRDFQVIAGRRGLNREIQGVTFLEAPDGPHWAVGKELTFSSGYVFAKEEDYVQNYNQNFMTNQAAMVIKRGRYLSEIPEEMIRIFEENQVPLITMPYSIPWMEAINQVNVAVMNHAIQRFCVNINFRFNENSRTYKEQKIQRILQTVENEMEFPSFLYDVFEEKSYYSSANFKKVSQQYDLKESDYWSPTLPYTSHTLCDCIHMTRFRLHKGEAVDEPRISWVMIPILVGGVPQAYFCVMESLKFLDFYDEYSMRIAFLMLQALYEQLAVARDASNIGFENLIHLALESDKENDHKLVDQANHFGLSMERPYLYLLFRHDHSSYDIRSKRSEMVELFRQCSMDRYGRLAFLSREEGLILLDPKTMKDSSKESVRSLLQEYLEKLQKKFQGLQWLFALHSEQALLSDIRGSVEKSRKVLKIGSVVSPEKYILDYDELGILTWVNIPEQDMKQLTERFRRLTESEKSRELLYTLKVYLENNMNYSLTAEKLFVNVNTIRRRMEKINELVSIDWDNYFERTKIGLMLQFLQ
ncbi:MAG: PucR family transcriptional regulator ligand-binding domain-containing protein [Oscillospiraceae bacterium]|nr:PucR family transcriptional regulator ligand-binding domain-containing protein [Oscillospiraceae bacterium]